MKVYRDMVFCWADCTVIACPRHPDNPRFKPEEEGLPVSFMDFSDTCTLYIRRINGDHDNHDKLKRRSS